MSIRTRRKFVRSGVALAATLKLQLAASAHGVDLAAPVCRLAAEQEEGPYYASGEAIRSAISEGKPGVPLSIRILVVDSRSCKPLNNVAVDLWHCDGLGLYAGFTKQNPMGLGGPGGPGGPPPGPPPGFDPQHPGNRPGPPEGFGPPPHSHATDNLTFCRGIQLSGANGAVTFHTIFPGFYMGRTNHVHFKMRLGGRAGAHTYDAGHTSHTGQLFFPEDLATALMEHAPYSEHKIHRTTQAQDMVFNGQNGSSSVTHVTFAKPGDPSAGIEAELIAAVDPDATPKPVGPRFGGAPPR